MKNDERYIETKNIICEKQCLIIDEESIISSKTLVQVYFIMHKKEHVSNTLKGYK